MSLQQQMPRDRLFGTSACSFHCHCNTVFYVVEIMDHDLMLRNITHISIDMLHHPDIHQYVTSGQLKAWLNVT